MKGKGSSLGHLLGHFNKSDTEIRSWLAITNADTVDGDFCIPEGLSPFDQPPVHIINPIGHQDNRPKSLAMEFCQSFHRLVNIGVSR
ncbi:hypothetical protein BVY04_03660 [bacterium M21]|nr:hypothetical protein BVY04_03660 [bacterium M21]